MAKRSGNRNHAILGSGIAYDTAEQAFHFNGEGVRCCRLKSTFAQVCAVALVWIIYCTMKTFSSMLHRKRRSLMV